VEDVIGLIILDEKRGERGIICWGRLYDSVDPSELYKRLHSVLPDLGFRNVISASVCNELADIARFEYFYEGLLEFASAKSMLTDQFIEHLKRDGDAFRKSLYLLGNKRC
jgi:hypothetical protein